MTDFANRTIFITGGSRGIGLAIAERLGKGGANVIITGKTDTPHDKLPGTIHSAAQAVEQAGGKALAIHMDVRNEEQVASAMKQAADKFGGIDVLVNNASAISLTPTLETSMKRFDLMFAVNVRGTFLASQQAIPYLKKSANPHILTLSPPLNMKPHWFRNHLAYTMSKYGMSQCVLGLAAEFKADGIAVNALWPQTTIATAAIEHNFPREMMQASRKPEIMADAAALILCRDAKQFTGQFFVDEQVLRDEGIADFAKYAINPEHALQQDLFLDPVSY